MMQNRKYLIIKDKLPILIDYLWFLHHFYIAGFQEWSKVNRTEMQKFILMVFCLYSFGIYSVLINEYDCLVNLLIKEF